MPTSRGYAYTDPSVTPDVPYWINRLADSVSADIDGQVDAAVAALTLTAPWVPLGSHRAPAVTTRAGLVLLTGVMTKGPLTAATPAFGLPVGARPGGTIYLTAQGYPGAGSASCWYRLKVEAGGNVYVDVMESGHTFTQSGAWVSLAGVCFPAEG